MSEYTEEVRVLRTEYVCETQGCSGVMRPAGIAYPTRPPMLVHTCTKCGRQATFHHEYPRITYETKVPQGVTLPDRTERV